jgi:hypothetical protein
VELEEGKSRIWEEEEEEEKYTDEFEKSGSMVVVYDQFLIY